MRRGLWLFAALAGVLSAQEAVRFDVASIKPADRSNHAGSSSRITPDGSLQAHSVPMLALIMGAYDVRTFQVTGYPQWVAEDSFDISAKSGEGPSDGANPSKARYQLRLQALLAERCGLVVRHAMTMQTVYDLTVDAASLKIKAAPESEVTRYGAARLHAEGISMAGFVRILTNSFNATILDETGLAGFYRIDLNWTRPDIPNAQTADVPELPLALREQLGLRLVKRQAQAEMLVVESIHKPSVN